MIFPSIFIIFSGMEIRKPKQFIKPTAHSKEVREIFDRMMDMANGLPSGMSFYFTNDSGLKLSSVPMLFNEPYHCLDKIEEIMSKPNFASWAFDRLAEEHNQVGIGNRLFIAPGIFIQEFDHSVVEQPNWIEFQRQILGTFNPYEPAGIGRRTLQNIDTTEELQQFMREVNYVEEAE